MYFHGEEIESTFTRLLSHRSAFCNFIRERAQKRNEISKQLYSSVREGNSGIIHWPIHWSWLSEVSLQTKNVHHSVCVWCTVYIIRPMSAISTAVARLFQWALRYLIHTSQLCSLTLSLTVQQWLIAEALISCVWSRAPPQKNAPSNIGSSERTHAPLSSSQQVTLEMRILFFFHLHSLTVTCCCICRAALQWKT